ncbi:MAG: hypothetical protein LQ342_008579, partial [Letrouitia transgressa]
DLLISTNIMPRIYQVNESGATDKAIQKAFSQIDIPDPFLKAYANKQCYDYYSGYHLGQYDHQRSEWHRNQWQISCEEFRRRQEAEAQAKAQEQA